MPLRADVGQLRRLGGLEVSGERLRGGLHVAQVLPQIGLRLLPRDPLGVVAGQRHLRALDDLVLGEGGDSGVRRDALRRVDVAQAVALAGDDDLVEAV